MIVDELYTKNIKLYRLFNQLTEKQQESFTKIYGIHHCPSSTQYDQMISSCERTLKKNKCLNIV
jgi:hypothetical protein